MGVMPAASDWVIGPDGKPCRSCTAFKSMVGMKKKGPAASAPNTSTSTAAAGASAAALLTNAAEPSLPSDCPPDVERLGRHTWTFLHTAASYYPPSPSPAQKTHMLGLLSSLPHLYPCSTCAGELKTYMASNPPTKAVEGRGLLEKYLCDVHNDVNVRLGKQAFDCDTVGERWREGWKDGRCDP